MTSRNIPKIIKFFFIVNKLLSNQNLFVNSKKKKVQKKRTYIKIKISIQRRKKTEIAKNY